MSYLHLFYSVIMTLMFSGKPAPAKQKQPAPQMAVSTVREETATTIPWSFDRRLGWNDFLGTPLKNTDAVATTSTTLGLSYRIEAGQLVYQVSCDFSKIKSWGSLRTDYILSHEQGHFDITEIHARRLFEAMQQYQFNSRTYKQDINAIYQAIVRSKEAMQAAYDAETDHSRRRARQYEWEEKINQMLMDTEVFAGY